MIAARLVLLAIGAALVSSKAVFETLTHVGNLRNDDVISVPASGAVYFVSPNYPAAYPHSYRGHWTFQGPENSSLQFDAVSFDTEGVFDVLELTDGSEGLGTFSGTSGPTDVRSNGNTVIASFRTDISIARTGFNVSVKVAKCRRGLSSCPNHEDVCLQSGSWCNGVRDCPDGADENCPDAGECGKASIGFIEQEHLRIVGGIEARPHSWPWQVALTSTNGRQFCGGSILNRFWVMSAAHCCAGRTPDVVRVVAGAHDLNATGAEGAFSHTALRVINHPGYSQNPTNNDFCLIKVQEPFQFGQNVATVCLPTVADPLETSGTHCYTTGWGRQSYQGIIPTKLRQVPVTIRSQAQCNAAYGNIRPQMICADEPGRGNCNGDSGGPLVCRNSRDDAWELIGVVSWGRPCAVTGYPTVYGRTTAALDWMAQTMVTN